MKRTVGLAFWIELALADLNRLLECTQVSMAGPGRRNIRIRSGSSRLLIRMGVRRGSAAAVLFLTEARREWRQARLAST